MSRNEGKEGDTEGEDFDTDGSRVTLGLNILALAKRDWNSKRRKMDEKKRTPGKERERKKRNTMLNFLLLIKLF